MNDGSETAQFHFCDVLVLHAYMYAKLINKNSEKTKDLTMY